MARTEGNQAQLQTSVDGWIVQAPYAHPVWHSYWVACVTLRDVEGLPPAVIHRPGATHEIIVYALNPEKPTTIDEPVHFLTPSNFVGQFTAWSDEAAREIIGRVVRDIIDGILNPDTDFRSIWIARFGDWRVKR